MLAGAIPDATVWMRDLAAVSRPLGRWHDHPQYLGWDEIRDNWEDQNGRADRAWRQLVSCRCAVRRC